ncbi:X-Pro dipeptidyl-peptidase, partial [bacterium]
IDVWPSDSTEKSPKGVSMAGYQQMVRVEVMRGKFRDSLSQPKPFEPGKPTRVNFKLNDLLHSFRPGHRLMVQIQSSWFPLVDRNPNRFLDIYSAKDTDFQKATVRVLRGGKHASRVVLRELL